MNKKYRKNIVCLLVGLSSFILMMNNSNKVFMVSIILLAYTLFRLINTILYTSNPSFWKSVHRRKKHKNITNTIYDLKLILPNISVYPKFKNIDNGILIFALNLVIAVMLKSNVFNFLANVTALWIK